ncbi:MAG TPA: endolytic transglycosylase MltG [Candidatus Paceibacterota bacterium]|nr:endolytic transglycosylase MltG [Candidatus Paceibacterota bacterium]
MEGRSRRRILFLCAAAALALAAAVLVYAHYFGPAGDDGTQVSFVVSPNETPGDIAARLKQQGLIRSEFAFRVAYLSDLAGRDARPGGYELAKTMDVWTLASTLAKSPYLAWVTIPPGLRKEQIADLLAQDLSWTNAEKEEWVATDTNPSPSYTEGVYYPDTYLIPSDEPPVDVAQRLRDRFAEVFAPYAAEAQQQNIKWTTVLTIASLIEREAAGPDMKLIAGIIWNRLDDGMKLQLDASLQYIKGNEETGWWPVVHSEDKYLDSPFNTYQNVGLPPHPIAEPSLAAIDAVLNPEPTNCIYYLHDPHGQIHCSKTYSGQVANVNKYLK